MRYLCVATASYASTVTDYVYGIQEYQNIGSNDLQLLDVALVMSVNFIALAVFSHCKYL
jgi:hypothetical protein